MKVFTFANNRKTFASLLACFFVFGLLGANWRIEHVSAQSTIRDEYLPPFLIADLTVNISSSFFNENIIISSQESENQEISIQQTQDSIRYALSSVATVEDIERGWGIFYVSLSASKGSAEITPAIVSKVEDSNYYHPKLGNYKIQKSEHHFIVPAEYPTAFSVSQLDNSSEKPRIGYESFYEDQMSIQDFAKDRVMSVATQTLNTSYIFFDNYERGGIRDAAIP
jgi:hypothetical protein